MGEVFEVQQMMILDNIVFNDKIYLKKIEGKSEVMKSAKSKVKKELALLTREKLTELQRSLHESEPYSQNIINEQTFGYILNTYNQQEQLRKLCLMVMIAWVKGGHAAQLLRTFYKQALELFIKGIGYAADLNLHIFSEWCHEQRLSLRVKALEQIFYKLDIYPSSQFLWSVLRRIAIQIHEQSNKNMHLPIPECYEYCKGVAKYMKSRSLPETCDRPVACLPFLAFISLHIVKSAPENDHHMVFDWAVSSVYSDKNMLTYRSIMRELQSQVANKDKAALLAYFLTLPFRSPPSDVKLTILILYWRIYYLMLQQPHLSILPGAILQHSLANMFSLGEYCWNLIHGKTLQPQFKKNKQLQEDDSLTIEECELRVWRVLNSIEKCLPIYPIPHYQEAYLEKPNIFNEGFIELLLKHRPVGEVEKLFVDLFKKYLDNPFTPFSIVKYFSLFLKHCLLTNTPKTLHHFLSHLNTQQFLALNQAQYRYSFHESEPQTHLPSTLSPSIRNSELKAAGYENKTTFLDRMWHIGPQLLAAEGYLYALTHEEHYYIIKHFYTFVKEHQESYPLNLREMVEQVEKCLEETNVVRFCSILHLLFTLGVPVKTKQEIVELLFVQFDRIQNLQKKKVELRRESLRQMHIQPQQMQEYRHEEQQQRKMHKLTLKYICRFLEDLHFEIEQLLPAKTPYEDIINQIIQYGKSSDSYVWRCIYVLSRKCSRDIFMAMTKHILKTSLVSQEKCQLFRQYIFSLWETTNSRQYEYLMQLPLAKDGLLFCVELLEHGMVESISERELMKCKIVALEVVLELARRWNRGKSELERMKVGVKDTLVRILEKHPNVVGRYERKTVSCMRAWVMKWMVEEVETNSPLFNMAEVYTILWHLSLDEDIQIRVLLLNILISPYSPTILHTNLTFILSILVVAATLEPNQHISPYTDSILRLYAKQLEPTTIVHLFLTLCSWLHNCQHLLPLASIFTTFIRIFVEKRDMLYLLYIVSEEVEKKGWKLKKQHLIKLNIKPYKTQYKTSHHVFMEFKKAITEKNKRQAILQSSKWICIQWEQLKKLGVFVY